MRTSPTPRPAAHAIAGPRRWLRLAVVSAAALTAAAVSSAMAADQGVSAPVHSAAPLRFQFGTGGSPVAAGYTLVTEKTVYSHKRGFGWHPGDEVIGRDRERGDPLRRSLDFGGYLEFLVDVPNGTYDVTVTMGDPISAHDEMGLLLQGKRVDAVTTAAGEFHVATYHVSVGGGQLSVILDDLGGENLDAVINALEIIPAVTKP